MDISELEKIEELYNLNSANPTGMLSTMLRPYFNMHPLYKQLQELYKLILMSLKPDFQSIENQFSINWKPTFNQLKTDFQTPKAQPKKPSLKTDVQSIENWFSIIWNLSLNFSTYAGVEVSNC